LGEREPKALRSALPDRHEALSPQEHGEHCGGPGGVPYLSVAQSSARLKRVSVWHRVYVDGIELETDVGVLPPIGGTGMHRDVRRDSFELERDEYLTGITVEYWRFIDRITFHTNKREYGPYGGPGGVLRKKLQAPPGKSVVGFKGRHWQLVDSIQLVII
jgi:hypothetical protein